MKKDANKSGCQRATAHIMISRIMISWYCVRHKDIHEIMVSSRLEISTCHVVVSRYGFSEQREKHCRYIIIFKN